MPPLQSGRYWRGVMKPWNLYVEEMPSNIVVFNFQFKFEIEVITKWRNSLSSFARSGLLFFFFFFFILGSSWRNNGWPTSKPWRSFSARRQRSSKLHQNQPWDFPQGWTVGFPRSMWTFMEEGANNANLEILMSGDKILHSLVAQRTSFFGSSLIMKQRQHSWAIWMTRTDLSWDRFPSHPSRVGQEDQQVLILSGSGQSFWVIIFSKKLISDYSTGRSPVVPGPFFNSRPSMVANSNPDMLPLHQETSLFLYGALEEKEDPKKAENLKYKVRLPILPLNCLRWGVVWMATALGTCDTSRSLFFTPCLIVTVQESWPHM